MGELLHEPQTGIERKSNRQIWTVTLITAAVILLIAIGFLITRFVT